MSAVFYKNTRCLSLTGSLGIQLGGLALAVSVCGALQERKSVVFRRVIRPGGGGNSSLYFVWYRRAAGIAPIFQVIYTSIDHDFISNVNL